MKFEIESMPLFDQIGRATALKKLAQVNGISFQKKLPFGDLPKNATGFGLFKHKSFKKIRNVFYLQNNELPGEVLVFDFLHADDGLDTKRTTVVLVQSELLELPRFHVKPVHLGHKLGGLFVSRDDAVEGHPDFIEKYTVTGPDLSAVEYALKQEVLDFLPLQDDWSMEGEGDCLVFYKKNKTQKPDVIFDFSDDAVTMAKWMIFSDSNDYV